MDRPFRQTLQSIGLITLDMNCAGARSAGNPHATCDVAGAGNGFTVRLVRHSQRKRGANKIGLTFGIPRQSSTLPLVGVKSCSSRSRRIWQTRMFEVHVPRAPRRKSRPIPITDGDPSQFRQMEAGLVRCQCERSRQVRSTCAFPLISNSHLSCWLVACPSKESLPNGEGSQPSRRFFMSQTRLDRTAKIAGAGSKTAQGSSELRGLSHPFTRSKRMASASSTVRLAT
jgi:hypothetical protein